MRLKEVEAVKDEESGKVYIVRGVYVNDRYMTILANECIVSEKEEDYVEFARYKQEGKSSVIYKPK